MTGKVLMTGVMAYQGISWNNEPIRGCKIGLKTKFYLYIYLKSLKIVFHKLTLWMVNIPVMLLLLLYSMIFKESTQGGSYQMKSIFQQNFQIAVNLQSQNTQLSTISDKWT